MSAEEACRSIVRKPPAGFFTHVEQVHLVLTTYAKGEPVAGGGDINHALPPEATVWIVEVHARAVNWNHSVPPGYKPPKRPYTDYAVVMDAETGNVTDAGEGWGWPLPLWKVGAVVSLPADC